MTTLFATSIAAAQARAEPLRIVVRAEGSGCDPGLVYSAIAKELGGTTDPGSEPGSGPGLLVTCDQERLSVLFRDRRGFTIRRDISRPPTDDSILRTIAYLAGNLVRDEAAELLGSHRSTKAAKLRASPSRPHSRAAEATQTATTPPVVDTAGHAAPVPPSTEVASSQLPPPGPVSSSATAPAIMPTPADRAAPTNVVAQAAHRRVERQEGPRLDRWSLSALAGPGLVGSSVAAGRFELEGAFRHRWLVVSLAGLVHYDRAVTSVAAPLSLQLRAPTRRLCLQIGVGTGLVFAHADSGGAQGAGGGNGTSSTSSSPRNDFYLLFRGAFTVGYPVTRRLDLLARVDYGVAVPLAPTVGEATLTLGIRAHTP
jgi:hypothetical protein